MTDGSQVDDLASVLGVDRAIHEPARLLVVSILYVVDQADFLFLRRQTGLTGGNLSSHTTKLEEAGYVLVDKRFVGKRPQTLFSLTRAGRRAFESYRATILQLLDSSSRPHA